MAAPGNYYTPPPSSRCFTLSLGVGWGRSTACREGSQGDPLCTSAAPPLFRSPPAQGTLPWSGQRQGWSSFRFSPRDINSAASPAFPCWVPPPRGYRLFLRLYSLTAPHTLEAMRTPSLKGGGAKEAGKRKAHILIVVQDFQDPVLLP